MARDRDHGIMQGFPPPIDRRPTLANWDSPPFNRWSFQHVREILPTAEVRCAPGPATAFEAAPRELTGLRFETTDGRDITVGELLDETHTDGFLVLHRGRLVCELYFNAMEPHTLHLSQSVSKSLVGALAGILIGRGDLDPQAPLSDHVPELAGCGYADATLNHLLDMRSGVRFSEDYGVADSDVTREEIVCGWKPRPPDLPEDFPDSLCELILTLPRERDHGGSFKYRSIESDVIGWVLERASGTRLAELTSRELWQPLGCERDACFTVDRAGFALVDGGFNATLRDYARFGQMHCDDGFFNGRQVVPADFVAQTRIGDPDVFDSPYKLHFPRGAYRNQFWIRDVDKGDKVQYMARGIFGQLIYIDAPRRLVAVKLSSWPDFLNPAYLLNTLAAIDAIAETLDRDR